MFHPERAVQLTQVLNLNWMERLECGRKMVATGTRHQRYWQQCA
jgi:hypothetical protein